MPRRSAGGYLNRLRSIWRDVLFRSAVVGTLIIVASIFATRPTHKPTQEQSSSAQTNQKTSEKIENNGFIGISSDAWTAIFTGVLTLFTGLLVTTGYVQIRYLIRADETGRKSADAAKQAADVARDALVATQRAWLKVRLSLMSELTFSDDHANLRVLCQATNIGNAPAKRVVIEMFLVCARKGHRFEKYFDAFLDGAGFEVKNRGFVIMPNETFPEDAFRHARPLRLYETISEALSIGDTESLSLAIIGCVFYQFDTDPVRFHRSPFLYEISRNGMGIFPDEGSVPQAEIVLSDPAFPLYVQPD